MSLGSPSPLAKVNSASPPLTNYGDCFTVTVGKTNSSNKNEVIVKENTFGDCRDELIKIKKTKELFKEIILLTKRYGGAAFTKLNEITDVNNLTLEIIDNTIDRITNPSNSTNSLVYKNDKLTETLIPKLKEMKKYFSIKSALGGAPKPFKKSKESIVISGKKHMIYLGPRSGKYIKKDNKYVSLSKLKKLK